MKRKLCFALFIVLALILSACGPSEADEKAKIQGTMDEYSAAVLEGNLERWISIWQEDAVRMPANQPQAVGVEQIKASVAPGFEMINTDKFNINMEEIQVLGDEAYARGVYSYAMTPKGGGDRIESSGKFLTLFEKQEDGSWKIAVDSFSENAPPAPPPAPADADKEADGVWCYVPVFDRLEPVTFDPYEGDPGKEFFKVPYQSRWTGLISGESTGYGMLIGHVIDPELPSEPFLFVDTDSFTEAEIDGKVGGLHLDIFGDRDDLGSDWKGTWIITGGTDELESVSGKGTFWGPGWSPTANTEECGEWGLIYYKGQIEFDAE